MTDEAKVVAVIVADPLGPPEQAPKTDETNDYRVRPPPPCEGCGGPAHGPTNELIHCLTRHLRAARAEAPRTMQETMCKGCGKSHQSHDQHAACLEKHLDLARERLRLNVGVSTAEFKANQASSKAWEQRRGKNKKPVGGP